LLWIHLRFRETLAAGGAAAPSTTRERNPLRALLALPDRAIRRANLVGFLVVFGFSFFETTISFFTADKLGFDPWKLAQIFIYLGVISIITQGYLVRRIIPRIGEKRAAVGGIGLQALGLLGLGWAIGIAESVPMLYFVLTF